MCLDLAHALSDAIEATENERHNIQGNDTPVESKSYAFTNINDKIDYALNVYKPLMDKDLIASISKHKKADSETTLDVNRYGLEH